MAEKSVELNRVMSFRTLFSLLPFWQHGFLSSEEGRWFWLDEVLHFNAGAVGKRKHILLIMQGQVAPVWTATPAIIKENIIEMQYRAEALLFSVKPEELIFLNWKRGLITFGESGLE